ncbi:MAG: LysM peptidoglycan-binding domain-containing protein [Clostridia bacterium]|nr:LysM peptidoglycan-binding domain-containing protein [Clostridia bacterium]
MKKKIYLKNPERLIICIVILFFILFGIFGFQNVSLGESVPNYITIKVSKGDTLWTIASDYVKDGEDIRDVIAEIKELNNLKNSNIKVGQELTIKV